MAWGGGSSDGMGGGVQRWHGEGVICVPYICRLLYLLPLPSLLPLTVEIVILVVKIF